MVKEFDPLDKTLIGGDAPAAPQTSASGLFAGRYQIERQVGRGGMGTVYRAQDVMVGDVVALKVLDIAITREGDQLEWFRREVRLARRITHPNVARTHDMGEQGGSHYISMEFIEGTTLQDILRSHEGDGAERRQYALEPVRAARIAIAVCDGLTAAHAAGVVHRDLKPANILIENTGRVVLTDFGIARALVDDGRRTQGLVGTPLYMSPEQVSGLPIDQRTDIYAVGLMLYEMLTGALPFMADSPIAAALARLTQVAPDPRTLRADIPEPIALLILQCLEQTSAQRPTSAAEVADRLRAWLLASGESLAPGVEGPVLAAMAAAAHSGATTVASTGVATPGSTTPGSTTPNSNNPSSTIPSSNTPSSTTPGSNTAQAASSGVPSTGRATPTSGPSPRSGVATGAMRPLAPVPTAERALAVLPFRFHGPADQSYLGDALADELIDVLSRTRGLRVLGSGATARYRDNRDARAVGADLGVDAVVDATVQSTATQIRVLARLVEVGTGVQLWSDRFESRIEDLFELQDRISKRIAEALRVELTTVTNRGDAPAEAVALYLRARRKIYSLHVVGSDGAVELLEACLELAPDFRPAIASYAVASMRAWFMPGFNGEQPDRDWAIAAREAVARALDLAPDIAETHLARAMLAVQTGAWRDAVQALVKALEIAPTFPYAHQYLAQLQCEAGNTREGIERAMLAVDLEPSLLVSLFDVARVHALRGEFAEFEKVLERFESHARYRSPTTQIRLRVAGWVGDLDRVRDLLDGVRDELPVGFGWFTIGYARALIGELDRDELEDMAGKVVNAGLSPRLHALMCQMVCEIYCARELPEDALKYFQLAADGVLIDMEWVDRCPSLKVMRGLPGFVEARRKVRTRVQAMWSV